MFLFLFLTYVNVLNRHTESESDSLLNLRVQPLAHLNAAVVHLRVQQKMVKMLQKNSGKEKWMLNGAELSHFTKNIYTLDIKESE